MILSYDTSTSIYSMILVSPYLCIVNWKKMRLSCNIFPFTVTLRYLQVSIYYLAARSPRLVHSPVSFRLFQTDRNKWSVPVYMGALPEKGSRPGRAEEPDNRTPTSNSPPLALVFFAVLPSFVIAFLCLEE